MFMLCSMTAAQHKAEASAAPSPHPAGVPHDVVVRETEAQLQDLNRMRAAGMMFIDRMERRANGLLRYDEEKIFERGVDIFTGFARVSRAVRQIIVLEQEIFGLRPPSGTRAAANGNAPATRDPYRTLSERSFSECDTDRSDLNDLNDYDNGPIDVVVARIAKTLGVEPKAPVGWLKHGETSHMSQSAPINPDVSTPGVDATGSRSTQSALPGTVKSSGNRGPP
jgi:hypothetical protein